MNFKNIIPTVSLNVLTTFFNRIFVTKLLECQFLKFCETGSSYKTICLLFYLTVKCSKEINMIQSIHICCLIVITRQKVYELATLLILLPVTSYTYFGPYHGYRSSSLFDLRSENVIPRVEPLSNPIWAMNTFRNFI